MKQKRKVSMIGTLVLIIGAVFTMVGCSKDLGVIGTQSRRITNSTMFDCSVEIKTVDSYEFATSGKVIIKPNATETVKIERLFFPAIKGTSAGIYHSRKLSITVWKSNDLSITESVIEFVRSDLFSGGNTDYEIIPLFGDSFTLVER